MKKLSFLLICVASKKYGFGHLNRSISFSHYINKKHSSKIITFTNDTIQQKLNKCKPNLIKKFDKKLNDKDIEKYDFVIFDISNNLFLKNNKIIKHLEKISNRYSEKIIIIDVIQNNIVPYIPRRCAILLLPRPNSDVVNISFVTVLSITLVF